MKVYRDIFGNPLPKSHVAIAARLIVEMNRPATSLLTRNLGWGCGKASRVIEVLEDAGVISLMYSGKRTVILKNEDAAVNAALRQLRKGRKTNVG